VCCEVPLYQQSWVCVNFYSNPYLPILVLSHPINLGLCPSVANAYCRGPQLQTMASYATLSLFRDKVRFQFQIQNVS